MAPVPHTPGRNAVVVHHVEAFTFEHVDDELLGTRDLERGIEGLDDVDVRRPPGSHRAHVVKIGLVKQGDESCVSALHENFEHGICFLYTGLGSGTAVIVDLDRDHSSENACNVIDGEAVDRLGDYERRLRCGCCLRCHRCC